jgi:hypothetical protein
VREAFWEGHDRGVSEDGSMPIPRPSVPKVSQKKTSKGAAKAALDSRQSSKYLK